MIEKLKIELQTMTNNIDKELIIHNVSKIIHELILDNEELAGKCMITTLYLKKYLLDTFNILIDINYGVVEVIEKSIETNEYKLSTILHSWNSYNNKIIDITIHNQSKDISQNATILNETINTTNKNTLLQYFDYIEVQHQIKRDYNNEDNKINFDKMIKWNKNNINSILYLHTYLKENNLLNQYSQFKNYIDNKL